MAGHSDARMVMFGSSVTGFSDRSGTSFDTGGKSDCDLAIVSHGAVFSSTCCEKIAITRILITR